MGNQTDYFLNQAYKPKYFLGDRVFGRWNKIPFIGTVANDGRVSEEEGPKVSVLLDLPVLHKEKIHTVVTVKHRDLKPLAEF